MKVTQVANNDTRVGTGALEQARGHEIAERSRGFEEGTMWAREFATCEQVRGLVARASLGWALGLDLLGADCSGPYWDGFLEAAEEVLASAGGRP